MIKWFKKWRLMRSDISVLNLKKKCELTLRHNGVFKIRQLVKLTEKCLVNMKRVGKRSVIDIKSALAKHDLELTVKCFGCGAIITDERKVFFEKYNEENPDEAV